MGAVCQRILFRTKISDIHELVSRAHSNDSPQDPSHEKANVAGQFERNDGIDFEIPNIDLLHRKFVDLQRIRYRWDRAGKAIAQGKHGDQEKLVDEFRNICMEFCEVAGLSTTDIIPEEALKNPIAVRNRMTLDASTVSIREPVNRWPGRLHALIMQNPEDQNYSATL